MRSVSISLIVILMSGFWAQHSCAQKPFIQWQRTLGGNADDQLYDLILTSDGGYMAVGRSESGISGDKTEANRGGTDIWIVKLDAQGATQWQKTLGAKDNDHAANIIQTSDGGYALGGFSAGGISGDRTTAAKGYVDYWIIKLTAAGAIQWQKTYGGITEANQAYTFIQTADGGFLLGGMSTGLKGPPGDKTEDVKGDFDYWIIKTDASGNLQWDKTLGGDQWDQMSMAALTTDGGYVVSGWSRSGISADKTEAGAGGQDAWLLKLNSTGIPEWQKTLGGNADEFPSRLLQQTSDGGYMAGSTSRSGVSGNRTAVAKGGNDFWLIKLNALGNITWQKALGGDGDDQLEYGYQTSDNGYLLAGHSASDISGDKTLATQGRDDWWIVKLTETGVVDWQWAFGGSGDDVLTVMHPTADGGYILGGYSESGISGDKSENSRGGKDFWVIKLGPRAPEIHYTNCKGPYNKAWVTPASADDNNYTYSWYDAGNHLLQTHTGMKGDTLLHLAPGSYSVTVKNAFGVNTLLPFAIQPEDYAASFTTGTICKDASFTITNTSTHHFIAYQWDFGDGTSASDVNPSHVYTQAKAYSIRLVAATASGCNDTAVVNAQVNTLPLIVSENYSNTACSGTPLVFRDGYSEPVAAYYWNFGEGSTATTATPDKIFTRPGKYTVQHSVTSNNGCSADTITNEVTIYETPDLHAGADVTMMAGDSVVLKGTINNFSYPVQWSPATYLSDAAILNPVAAPPIGERYYYLSAEGEAGCMAYDTVKVTVLENILIPNIFSPNHDNIHDTWDIPSLNIYPAASVQVFNRWGQLVFRTTGYATPWDGTINGKPLPVGTYYYIIDRKNGSPVWKGAVTIVK